MTPDEMKIMKEAAVRDDSVIVRVVPANRVGDLFPTPSRSGPAFEVDLSVAGYREEYEPHLSESRIRKLCADGAFPDTTGGEGEVVPGAYKNSGGEWRITLEGIVARRRAERRRGARAAPA